MKLYLRDVESESRVSPFVHIPDDSSALHVLTDLKGVIHVRAAEGTRDTWFTLDDMASSSSSGEAVVPTWSSADRVIVAYGLEALVLNVTKIMRDMFGADSRLVPEVSSAPNGETPLLVLRLHVPRALRHLRETFLDRYTAEAVIPEGAPVPAVLLTYDVGVPT